MHGGTLRTVRRPGDRADRPGAAARGPRGDGRPRARRLGRRRRVRAWSWTRALARGLARYGSDRLGPGRLGDADPGHARRRRRGADRGLVRPRPRRSRLLVALATVALVLDAVDGRVARRTGTASPLGARFDGEVDAFLIVALSVYVARTVGAWVLAIGAARYAFLVAEWLLPWMRAPLPPRYWRKVVAATQGIALTVAAADVLPLALTRVAPGRRARPAGRVVRPRRVVAVAPPARASAGDGVARTTGHGRVRTGIAVVLTVLAFAARVGRPRRSEPAEPPHARRVPAAPARGRRRRRPGARPARQRAAHPGLGRRAGARSAGAREDPRHRVLRGLRPAVQPGRRLELHRASASRRCATRSAGRARTWRRRRGACSVVAVARPHDPGGAAPDPGRGGPPPGVAPGRRGARRRLGALLGVRRAVVSGAPVASTSAAGLAVHEVRAVRAGVQDQARLRRRDPPRPLPRTRPATSC